MSGEITIYDHDEMEYKAIPNNGAVSFFTTGSGRIDVYLNRDGITVKTQESVVIKPIVGNMVEIGNSKP